MTRGRPRKNPSDPGKLPFQQGLQTRQVTPEEAERYGIKMSDIPSKEVEWYSNSINVKDPSIGFQKSGGIHINKEAGALLGIKEGDKVQIGFRGSPRQIVLRKSEDGMRLRAIKGNNKGSGFKCFSAGLVKWINEKGAEAKRYVIRPTDEDGIFVANLYQ
ncbi:hypothetical protein PUW25_26240 (plasmid) [Paenibacillus urinalis]|uniref:SpoVT-AbrB domain-containing protein n=1 Tax=Paenibacillus urinalis TaxID=521520 RepID=A0ABY7XH15_9BACL|nr:hypothetical protein [Paenibacillus urinalis]WDI05072.1 hypothetical protein PUW25_26240 [Paenibacillus urinalis]